MSKYYLDCEFLEGTQKTLFGNTPPTIDLISIGIVSADGREYYAISKDFNLKEAWNRYDLIINKQYPIGQEYNKVYWIRENVLKPIYYEWYNKDADFHEVDHFTYKNFKQLLNKYGKTNKQIAEEIRVFISKPVYIHTTEEGKYIASIDPINSYPVFYGYYCDYDWVAFCWLFGKMMDLPSGFPMYCRDLRQEQDRLLDNPNLKVPDGLGNMVAITNTRNKLVVVKALSNYPKQTNEHNALADARWNLELYNFLNTI